MLVVLLCATPIGAQELRGTVTLPDGATPARGVIVLVQHPTRDSVIARAITGESGTYVVHTRYRGPVRLAALRIGFRPTQAGEHTISNAPLVVRIRLEESPVSLAVVDVRASSRCQLRPDSGQLVATLYGEVSKALMASSLRAPEGASSATYRLFSRIHDLAGRPMSAERRSVHSGPSDRPFASISVDSLAKVGYMVVDARGDMTFFGPDANVLLSDAFVATHCMHVVSGGRSRSDQIGLGFRPQSKSRKVDVEGTLWLDKSTGELRELEYRYRGVDADLDHPRVGGTIEYSALPGGLWFVKRWSIRMPITSRKLVGSAADRRRTGPVTQVDALQIEGGEVLSITRGREVLFAIEAGPSAGPPAPTATSAVAAASDVPAPASSPPTSPSTAASASTVETSSCGGTMRREYDGVVVGRVVDADGNGLVGATILAEWKEDFRAMGSNEWSWRTQRLSGTTSSQGAFVFCDVASARTVELRAEFAGRRSDVAKIRITDSIKRIEVSLEVASRKRAESEGAVLRVFAVGSIPLAHALVDLPTGARRVADENGLVRLPTVAADSIRVRVRRIGFTEFDGWVERTLSNEFEVLLRTQAQALAPVVTRATREPSPLERRGFYDRLQRSQRGALVGEFYTPEDVEARRSAKFSDLLATSRIVRTATYGRTSNKYILGRGNCVMAVTIDGHALAVKGGGGADPVDQIVDIGSVQAVEVYPSLAVAPPELITPRMSSTCGLIAIWTR